MIIFVRMTRKQSVYGIQKEQPQRFSAIWYGCLCLIADIHIMGIPAALGGTVLRHHVCHGTRAAAAGLEPRWAKNPNARSFLLGLPQPQLVEASPGRPWDRSLQSRSCAGPHRDSLALGSIPKA